MSMNITSVVEEAAKRLKDANNENSGLIIWKTAQEYGTDYHILAKALKKRQEGTGMSTKEYLDIEKVERIAKDKGMDLTELAEAAGLSHDVLRNVKRHPETPSRRKTVQKIAAALVVSADEIIRGDEPTTDTKYTKDELKKLKILAFANDMLPNEVEVKIVKKYLTGIVVNLEIV